MCTFSTSASLANCLRVRKRSKREKKMKLVTFAVFVMRTTKIASFCFYCVESGNHRVRTARVSTTAGAWKTDENIIQIDKFPITTGFSWLSPATGINIFSYFFLKLPRQVDRQHSDP